MSKILLSLAALAPLSFARQAPTPASPAAAGVPSHAKTLATSKEGDYLKFRQTQSADGQTQVLTLWHALRGLKDDSATVQFVLTSRTGTADEPLQTAGADVQIAEAPVPTSATLLDSGIAPGVTLVSDAITKLSDETLLVGPREVACQVFERLTTLSVPQGQAVVRNRVWWSADVPVSGLVRSEQTTSGIQSGSSVLELVAFPGLRDPAKVVVRDAHWFLAQARDAIVDCGWSQHDKDRFFEKLGDGYLALDDFEGAFATVHDIEEPVYQEALLSVLEVFAALDDGPGQRASVSLADPVEVEHRVRTFANVYGNALEGLSDSEVEALVARDELAGARDALWGARAWRLLLAGDRERARASFQRITSDGGRDTALGTIAYEASQLKRIDLLEQAIAFHPKGADGSSFLGSHYALLDELGREKEAFEVAMRYVAAVRALEPVLRTETTTSVLMLALYRPWSRVERFVCDRLLADDDTSDPEVEFARSLSERGATTRGGSYAKRAAARGNEAAARRILGADERATPHDARAAIAALYAAGKKDEAIAWLRSLEPASDAPQYLIDGVRAWTMLDFAAVEAFTGDTEAEARWLDEAESAALAGQKALVEQNRALGVTRYWEGGISMKSSAPFFLVGLRRIARGEHERALAIAEQSPSLRPGSGCVEDYWQHLATRAALRGDAAFATKVFARMPASVDANSSNWLVRKVARAFVLGGDVEGVEAFVEGLTVPLQRDLAISASIVQLSFDGHLASAEALFAPWFATKDPKQWADAKVSLALARANAGDVQRAIELFLAPRFGTDFTALGNVERSHVLIAFGRACGRACKDLDALGRLVVAIPDEYERAHVALGIAFGRATRPVPNEFVDRLRPSDP